MELASFATKESPPFFLFSLPTKKQLYIKNLNIGVKNI